MATSKKHIAKCFISYCHDDADSDSISAFEEQIVNIAGQNFKVIRDKSNIDPAGGSISAHEAEISECNVIITLFTPKYKEKVLNRRGGVYREHKKIMERFNEYHSKLKLEKSIKTFAFIPILFSGNQQSSYLPEISDRLYIDFTGFRAAPKATSHTLSTHRDQFTTIKAKFENVLDGLNKNFANEYDTLLNLLFLESKQEELRKTYRFKDKDELLENLFVKTKSFESVAARQSCILVGRKGSGKSTIVDHLHRNSHDTYKPPIRVIVDNFDLSLLYIFLFDQPNAQDIRHVAKLENFFEAVWVIFIYKECVRTIVNEENGGNTIVDLSEYLPELTEIGPKDELKWTTFVQTCEQVKNQIDDIIANQEAEAGFLSGVASKVELDSLITSVLGSTNLEALDHAIQKCKRHFVFALDGFDQRFEDFRTHSLRSTTNEKEKKQRIYFEIAWLRGLLRATLRLRSGDAIIKDKCDFCITIPQDRFIEVRNDEREDYRFRGTKSDVQWTAIELSILIRKRLEGLVFEFQSDPERRPLDRLNEVMQCPEHKIPLKIQINNFGNINTLSTFKYILRHTFWRPRDMMYYVGSILINQRVAKKRNAAIDESIIKEIISRTTYEVIETEFIKEFQNVFINIIEVLHHFENKKIVMSFFEISEILIRVDFMLNQEDEAVKSVIGKIDFLFSIGFLGFVQDDASVRNDSVCKDSFIFSDGDRKYRSLSEEKKKKIDYVIHPIFVEYLMLDTNIGRTVCYYSDEYLAKNDLLH